MKKLTAMDVSHSAGIDAWPFWRKLLFRFFFIYLALYMQPWTWLDGVPYVGNVTRFVTKFYEQGVNWLVEISNAKLFHVRPVLVYPNGSGDTSFNWTQLWLYLSLAILGTIVWSILDRRRKNYFHLNYWLCLFARYYVALIAFSYGIIKLFALQMPFPNLSQLATPLGDFLPMRLSWMFLGYSSPYQIFSGVMEVICGVLLLFRRTSTLGTLMATAVFTNVMMLNLTYDIPVKLFSMHMVVVCLFLLANEADRLLCFFVFNRPATVCNVYQYEFPKKWMKITKLALKLVFIITAVGMVFYETIEWSKSFKEKQVARPFARALYAVTAFTIKNDSLSIAANDSLRWKDLVIDNGEMGSIQTLDTSFRQRYHRGYFFYKTDTTAKTIELKKTAYSETALASFTYEEPDENSLILRGKQKNDSLFIELRKTNRHFQLAEKQFHWLSEYNR